jgi:hypothetical protein
VAIAFVKAGGTAGNKVGGNATLAVTVPAGGHAIGNTVVVAAGGAVGTAFATQSITDSRGNSYTLIEVYQGGTGFSFASLFASVLTTGLQAGDTITLTAGSGTFSRSALLAAEFSGASISENVASIAASVSGTAPSIGPITPVDAVTLVLAEISNSQQPTDAAFTEDSDAAGGDSWHGFVAGTTGGSSSSNIVLRLAYKITTSAVAQTYNPTTPTGSAYMTLAALQQAAVAAVIPDVGMALTVT